MIHHHRSLHATWRIFPFFLKKNVSFLLKDNSFHYILVITYNWICLQEACAVRRVPSFGLHGFPTSRRRKNGEYDPCRSSSKPLVQKHELDSANDAIAIKRKGRNSMGENMSEGLSNVNQCLIWYLTRTGGELMGTVTCLSFWIYGAILSQRKHGEKLAAAYAPWDGNRSRRQLRSKNGIYARQRFWSSPAKSNLS